MKVPYSTFHYTRTYIYVLEPLEMKVPYSTIPILVLEPLEMKAPYSTFHYHFTRGNKPDKCPFKSTNPN